jgi:hypothetical protein
MKKHRLETPASETMLKDKKRVAKDIKKMFDSLPVGKAIIVSDNMMMLHVADTEIIQFKKHSATEKLYIYEIVEKLSKRL